MSRHILFGAASILSLSVALPALAQTTTTTTPPKKHVVHHPRHGKTRAATPVAAAPAASVAAPAPAAAYSTTAASPVLADNSSFAREKAEEIQVTGSRVRIKALEEASPVVTVTAKSIQARGLTNTASVLNQLPQSGATGYSDTASNFSNDTAGISAVNLRNLGVSRTLVLIDGRRTVGSIPPGTGGANGVDVNTIPAYLLESVDISTGGQSAIYGSEAVAGVVNFHLRKSYNGVLFNQQYGVSGHGDGNTSTTDLLAGTSFAENRGNILIAGEYQKQDAIYSKDRGISSYDRGEDGVYTPSSYTVYGTFGTKKGNYETLGNGSVAKYVSSIYGFNRDAVRTIQIPTDKISLYSKFDYDIAPNLTVFANAHFSRTRAVTQLEPIAIGNTTTIGFSGQTLVLPLDNPYVPAGLSALSPTNDGDGNFATWRRRFLELGDRGATTNRYNWGINSGFRGNIFDRFDWETYYTYGETTSSNQGHSGNVQNLQNALNATTINGQIVCADATARANGCVPADIFGPGKISQAAVNYISAPSSYNDRLAETDLNADIGGPLFNLPYGPVRANAGFEYRRESGSTQPDALIASGTGLDTQGPATSGAYDVRDIYVNGVVPVLSNLPFAKQLSILAAYRYSNYSLGAVGQQSSYNYGMTYAPVKDIMFRVVNAVTIRAPTIDELYTGRSQSAVSVTDPCSDIGLEGAANPALRAANCAKIPGITPGFTEENFNQQSEISYQSGNPNLNAERAKVLTFGGVLQPRWVPGFNMTVDWWKYDIGNAIQSIDLQTTANECVDTGEPAFCNLVHRNGTTGLITGVDSQVINVGNVRESGIDVAVGYTRPISWSLSRRLFKNSSNHSALSFNWNYTYLNYLDYESVPGTITHQEGLFGAPKNKWNFDAMYSDDRFQFFYQMRYIGQQRYDYGYGPNVSTYLYHDISVRYQVTKNFQGYFGINNLADKKPPLVPQPYQQTGAGVAAGVTGTETVPQVYDVVGRYFYAGVRANF